MAAAEFLAVIATIRPHPAVTPVAVVTRFRLALVTHVVAVAPTRQSTVAVTAGVTPLVPFHWRASTMSNLPCGIVWQLARRRRCLRLSTLLALPGSLAPTLFKK